MRLIDTTTYEIEEFFGDIPKYAILSHTWEGREITYQDMQKDDFQTMPGFKKVFNCCKQARDDMIEWAWIDTCCIDKTSSVELSEAINSMFDWYAHAWSCYVHLSDVMETKDLEMKKSAFLKARWFARGWTLQELLAPERLQFFDRDWVSLGLKNSSFYAASLIDDWTSLATGILDIRGWENASVACKFSWAANRQTTRLEDQAYSLMGLFKVNMPLLYGEGARAFGRLQLEILSQSDDESIFAWSTLDCSHTGLLAGSAKAFEKSSTICKLEPAHVTGNFDKGFYERPPYTMTQKGIHLPAVALMWPGDSFIRPEGSLELVVIPLLCTKKSAGKAKQNQICIYLSRPNARTNQWVRICADIISELSDSQQAELHDRRSGSFGDFYVNTPAPRKDFSDPVQLIFEHESARYLGLVYEGYVIDSDIFLRTAPWMSATPTDVLVNLQPQPGSGFAVALTFRDTVSNELIFLVILGHLSKIRIDIALIGPPSEPEGAMLRKSHNVFQQARHRIAESECIGEAPSIELEGGRTVFADRHSVQMSWTNPSVPPRHYIKFDMVE